MKYFYVIKDQIEVLLDSLVLEIRILSLCRFGIQRGTFCINTDLWKVFLKWKMGFIPVFNLFIVWAICCQIIN